MNKLIFILLALCVTTYNNLSYANEPVDSNIVDKAQGNIFTIPLIKSKILGIELKEKLSHYQIKSTLEKNTGLRFANTYTGNGNTLTHVFIPLQGILKYGTMDWQGCGVMTTIDNLIINICFVSQHDTLSNAKEQYEQAVQLFTNKYDKANLINSNTISAWIDGVTAIRVEYQIDSNGKSTCMLNYHNVELVIKSEYEAKTDI